MNAPCEQRNRNAETPRLAVALARQLRATSGQADAAVPGMFHGRTGAPHAAREYRDRSRVAPRGWWGSPTARAFPVALRTASREAVAGRVRRRS